MHIGRSVGRAAAGFVLAAGLWAAPASATMPPACAGAWAQSSPNQCTLASPPGFRFTSVTVEGTALGPGSYLYVELRTPSGARVVGCTAGDREYLLNGSAYCSEGTWYPGSGALVCVIEGAVAGTYRCSGEVVAL